MKKKLLSKVTILALTATICTSIAAPTVASAKSLKASSSIMNFKKFDASNPQYLEFLKKFNLKESDMKKFANAVSNELASSEINYSIKGPSARISVSTIKNILKTILKFADLLPSWVANPIKNLFWPLLNALDKFVDVSLSGLKKIMMSVGFSERVADFIIYVIDTFFL